MISFLKKFVIGEWNLGICNQDFLKEFKTVKKGGRLNLYAKWVHHNHGGSFFADPFIYSVDSNNALILAEEYIYSRKKGVISICNIDRTTASMISRKIVLEETCHLSYPFYDEKTNRMAPESSRNNNWASYFFDGEKAYDKKVLSTEPFIDCTPVNWKGRWYLFAVKQPNALDQLLIYSADEKHGQYLPHPQNPVKEDITNSRPGGKCFIVDNEMYRIVQDSTNRYGERLHITHVTRLSPTEFEEEHWCDIAVKSCGKYSLGAHTLNFEGDFIVIDGFRERFRPLLAIYIYKIIPILSKLGLHK